MSKENRYTLKVQRAEAFLLGQLELYKIEFAETNYNGYLEVMNELNETLDTVKRMDKVINRIFKENQILKK